jgi:hypothetical protein
MTYPLIMLDTRTDLHEASCVPCLIPCFVILLGLTFLWFLQESHTI